MSKDEDLRKIWETWKPATSKLPEHELPESDSEDHVQQCERCGTVWHNSEIRIWCPSCETEGGRLFDLHRFPTE